MTREDVRVGMRDQVGTVLKVFDVGGGLERIWLESYVVYPKGRFWGFLTQ